MLIQADRTAAMRTSETERGRAADFLRDACADGRLSPDELDARLDELWSGRTVDDMRRLVRDLPGGEAVLPRLSARPRALPAPARPRRRTLIASGGTLLVVAAVLVAVLIALPDFVAFAAIAIVVALAMSTLLLTMLLAPVALVGVVVARLASWMFRRRWPT